MFDVGFIVRRRVLDQLVFGLVVEALDRRDQGVRDRRFLDDGVSREFACSGICSPAFRRSEVTIRG
jgi:hypothetical protein